MSDLSNELVMKASQGDMDAFEEVYRATSRFVYNVAFRITNNREDADEVTQDVFVKVFNGLREFGFRSSFKTWIYRIAANTAINHSKKNRRHDGGKVEYDPAVHDIEVPNDSRGSEIDKADTKNKIAALL